MSAHERALDEVRELLLGNVVSTALLREWYSLSPAQAKRDLSNLRMAFDLVPLPGAEWLLER